MKNASSIWSIEIQTSVFFLMKINCFWRIFETFSDLWHRGPSNCVLPESYLNDFNILKSKIYRFSLCSTQWSPHDDLSITIQSWPASIRNPGLCNFAGQIWRVSSSEFKSGAWVMWLWKADWEYIMKFKSAGKKHSWNANSHPSKLFMLGFGSTFLSWILALIWTLAYKSR